MWIAERRNTNVQSKRSTEIHHLRLHYGIRKASLSHPHHLKDKLLAPNTNPMNTQLPMTILLCLNIKNTQGTAELIHFLDGAKIKIKNISHYSQRVAGQHATTTDSNHK